MCRGPRHVGTTECFAERNALYEVDSTVNLRRACITGRVYVLYLTDNSTHRGPMPLVTPRREKRASLMFGREDFKRTVRVSVEADK